ncbi:hypothetical protein METH_17470 [Leisingera methylohalidivorans DSM 14336]|uniref:Uncharacterized protein n=1 Tax=Leisingera methylohalidivorans DSM 14336 TaxID=999552 RepID=V9W247_9RHOB|nr:hypothetical protein METH_17470 [Leisingera methylohalidivorans DSM 14336]
MMPEAIRPNMVAIPGLQTDARSIVQPEPPLLWLFHWHFKPLTPPQAFHAFVIHLPSCISQQGGNPAVAISTVLPCQLNHIRDQTLLVSPPSWRPTLCGPVPAQNTANASLRYLEPATHMINASASA